MNSENEIITEAYRKIQAHPCYSEKAQHRFGRMHLSVAPKCNIQCNYCVRKYDCVNESKPGITSKVLTPQDALDRTKEVIERHHFIKVVAVAGPGESLFNEETFETYRLVKEAFPFLMLCGSTNGLLLPDKAGILKELGLSNITITINAVTPEVEEKIYSFIIFEGRRYEGKEAATILLENQCKGLEKATGLGMLVKVNTVYVPTVNEEEIPRTGERAGRNGAFIQNIMLLIPQYKFSHLKPPTQEQRREMQERCRQAIHKADDSLQAVSGRCLLIIGQGFESPVEKQGGRIRDLKDFLHRLENEGELIRIEEELSPRYEVSAVFRQLAEGDNPEALVEKVNGYNVPVVGNIFGTRRRIALALETETDLILEEFQKRQRESVSPKLVKDAPVKEVIIKDEVDVLSVIPAMTYHKRDGGPFITQGIVFVRDPDSDAG